MRRRGLKLRRSVPTPGLTGMPRGGATKEGTFQSDALLRAWRPATHRTRTVETFGAKRWVMTRIALSANAKYTSVT